MTVFTDKAPKIMGDLMKDFALDMLSAAAIVGNLGHESGGFKFLQEIKPTVSGARGGFGWAQWTGIRRRAYEAYCSRNGLDPRSDKANYAFLFVELSGDYQSAIRDVKRAVDLRAKVIAFELAFERAGVKHYDSRVSWAEKALAAYRSAVKDGPIISPTDPDPPKPDDPGPSWDINAIPEQTPDTTPPREDGGFFAALLRFFRWLAS